VLGRRSTFPPLNQSPRVWLKVVLRRHSPAQVRPVPDQKRSIVTGEVEERSVSGLDVKIWRRLFYGVPQIGAELNERENRVTAGLFDGNAIWCLARKRYAKRVWLDRRAFGGCERCLGQLVTITPLRNRT
jgi:hypothetical protein